MTEARCYELAEDTLRRWQADDADLGDIATILAGIVTLLAHDETLSRFEIGERSRAARRSADEIMDRLDLLGNPKGLMRVAAALFADAYSWSNWLARFPAEDVEALKAAFRRIRERG